MPTQKLSSPTGVYPVHHLDPEVATPPEGAFPDLPPVKDFDITPEMWDQTTPLPELTPEGWRDWYNPNDFNGDDIIDREDFDLLDQNDDEILNEEDDLDGDGFFEPKHPKPELLLSSYRPGSSASNDSDSSDPGDSIRETSDKVEAILEQGGAPGKAAAAVVNAGAEIAATIVDIGAGLVNKAVDIASRTEVIQTPAGPKVVVRPPESGSGSGSDSSPPPPKPTPPKDHPQKDEDLGGTPPPSKPPTQQPPDKAGRPITDPGYVGPQPVILDLDGNGIQITEVSKSNVFLDAGGDGLKHRTAWAAQGNGVLFFDAGNDGQITEKREYVFTEWDPSADSDFAALRSRFDSNGDGKLTSADAEWASFKVMVTNADGSQTAMTLAQLGITEINLTPDATQIRLPDGSAITGQASFVINGQNRIAADTVLVAEADGHRVTQVVSTDGSGNRVVVSTAFRASGDVAYQIT